MHAVLLRLSSVPAMGIIAALFLLYNEAEVRVEAAGNLIHCHHVDKKPICPCIPSNNALS